MKTICPQCHAINESILGEMDSTTFEGSVFLLYPNDWLVCFHCGGKYVWGQGINLQWIGIPIPN